MIFGDEDYPHSDHVLNNLDPVEELAIELYTAGIASGKISPQIDATGTFTSCYEAALAITTVLKSKHQQQTQKDNVVTLKSVCTPESTKFWHSAELPTVKRDVFFVLYEDSNRATEHLGHFNGVSFVEVNLLPKPGCTYFNLDRVKSWEYTWSK